MTGSQAGNPPLPGVVVSIGGITGITDNNGNYTLTTIPAGVNTTITASETGYGPYTNNSLTVNNGNTTQNMVLNPNVVTGTVTDTFTGTPVSGATVSIGTLGATTDGSGLYSIIAVPAGSQNVTAVKAGYNATEVLTNVAPGGSTTCNITIAKSQYFGNLTGTVTDGVNPLSESWFSIGLLRRYDRPVGKLFICGVSHRQLH